MPLGKRLQQLQNIKYELMLQLYEDGYTTDDVGYVFNISRQAVSKGLKKARLLRQAL